MSELLHATTGRTTTRLNNKNTSSIGGRSSITPCAQSSTTSPKLSRKQIGPMKKFGHILASVCAFGIAVAYLVNPLAMYDMLAMPAADGAAASSALAASTSAWLACLGRFAGAAHVIVATAAFSLAGSAPVKMQRRVEAALTGYGLVVLAAAVNIVKSNFVSAPAKFLMYGYAAYVFLFYAFCLMTSSE